MTFYTYMTRIHIDESSPIGDLTRDIKRDEGAFPRNKTDKFMGWHKLIREYLESCGACRVCLDAFEECWEEYVKCEKNN